MLVLSRNVNQQVVIGDYDILITLTHASGSPGYPIRLRLDYKNVDGPKAFDMKVGDTVGTKDDVFRIKYLSYTDGRPRLGFDADRSVIIHRREVLDRINLAPAKGSDA